MADDVFKDATPDVRTTEPIISHTVSPEHVAPRSVIQPVRDISVYKAFPATSRERELKEDADLFASSGKQAFVHYTQPVLDRRRIELLSSRTTKKKYHKTASQLWTEWVQLDDFRDESFYWNEMVARVLRRCLKDGTLSHEDCLTHAGRLEDQAECVRHAETAVSRYLGTPPPAVTVQTAASAEVFGISETSGGDARSEKPAETMPLLKIRFEKATAISHAIETLAVDGGPNPGTPVAAETLLDTLPDRFEVEPRMLYSHFARYDFDAVRRAEGKHQTAMLRQLADLLDKTGKQLAYYYLVPRLCNQYCPPRDGATVTSKAGDVWRFLPGQQQDLWYGASQALKKQLGDGDIVGLEILQLETLEPEVLRLHGMAQAAIESHAARGK